MSSKNHIPQIGLNDGQAMRDKIRDLKAQLSAKEQENDRLRREALEREAAISMYVKRELEYKRFATHQQNEIDDLKFGIGIGNQGVKDLKERHVKEIQELRKRCEDLEAENKILQKYKDDTQPL